MIVTVALLALYEFQPTHPLRGATSAKAASAAPCCDFNPRPPCGVRRGIFCFRRRGRKFQSTHPLRGATTAVGMITDEREFQSTHPLRGATRHQRSDHRQRPISIHAPLAGCDVIGIVTIGQPGDFNPRTPCGVRPQHQTRNPIVLYFNPRTPCGVRPGQAAVNGTQELISIHAPLAGCDTCATFLRTPDAHFNPRTPCGVRRAGHVVRAAPWRFQSTHPLRGAT